jgi:uncharacterized protein (DUF433 family)
MTNDDGGNRRRDLTQVPPLVSARRLSVTAVARLKVIEGGVPVWALIGALTETGENAEAVARDYRVRRLAVDAAWAYYRRHRAAIDAKLAAALAP